MALANRLFAPVTMQALLLAWLKVACATESLSCSQGIVLLEAVAPEAGTKDARLLWDSNGVQYRAAVETLFEITRGAVRAARVRRVELHTDPQSAALLEE